MSIIGRLRRFFTGTTGTSPRQMLAAGDGALPDGQGRGEREESKGRYGAEEIVQILAKAAALREYEARRAAITELSSIAQVADGYSREEVEQVALEMAEPLGIEQRHIRSALAFVAPSLGEQKRIVDQLNASPSVIVIADHYCRKLLACMTHALEPYQCILERTVEAYSLDGGPGTVTCVLTENRPPRSRCLLAVLKLARVGDSYKFAADFHDPRFLSACGQALEELLQRFKKYQAFTPELRHHYDVIG